MSLRISRRAAALALVSTLLLLTSTARAQNYAEHLGINIGAPVWNSAPTFTEAVANELNLLGVRWIRMEFIKDPAGDFIDYADYDEIVNRANAHGLQILGLVDYASKQYSVQSDWANDAWADSFRDRVAEIVAHYSSFPSGPIRFWEVWNEPDSLGGVPAAKFARILAITYPAIKAIDPHATIISGGITSYSSGTYNYLRDMYASTSFQAYKAQHGIFPFDILGWHPYDWTRDPSVYLAAWCNTGTYRLRRVMNNNGDHYKRIWLTEYGWNSSTTAPTSLNPGGTKAANEAAQAAYLQHAYAIAQPLVYTSAPEYGPYLEKTFLFCYQDFYIGTEEFFGVVDGASAHKPAYAAYQGLGDNALQNAARQALVTASGEVAPGELAVYACDGTPFTKWASTGAIDDHALTLDLRRPYLVHEFRVVSAEMGHEPDYLNTKAFTIESSATGADPWTVEFVVQNNSREPVNILAYGTDQELRYVRLRITDANEVDGWARVPEFEVWGLPLEEPEPPPNPGDLDGDGDADLADFAILMSCYTGTGGTTPPAGCETLPPAGFTWESAQTVDQLSTPISATDLLAGITGILESGGFHSATPGGSAGGLADLTDGAKGAQAEAVLADYADPALQVRFDFATPQDIDAIQVFAANETNPGDGRVFQHYDVEYATVDDPAFRPLIANVSTGPFGTTNQLPATDPAYRGATLTRVSGPGASPVALQASALRFVFHPVSNVDGTFLNVPDAYVSSIIKEIDVFGVTGTPTLGNRADLDGDGDVDAADYATFAACFTGPADDPAHPPALPAGCP